MLFSRAEIETLKIIGTYMNAPAKLFEAKTLLDFEYVKYNKEHTNLRLTNAGAKILSLSGFEVKTQQRATGRTLERRLQGVQIATFFSELGIDVFLKDIPIEVFKPLYLSSLEMRRQKYENVLGISKFIGLLYTKNITYVVYNTSLSVLVLKEQVNALKVLLKENTAKIAVITAEEAFETLQIKPLENRRLQQFTNEKGVGIIAERFT